MARWKNIKYLELLIILRIRIDRKMFHKDELLFKIQNNSFQINHKESERKMLYSNSRLSWNRHPASAQASQQNKIQTDSVALASDPQATWSTPDQALWPAASPIWLATTSCVNRKLNTWATVSKVWINFNRKGPWIRLKQLIGWRIWRRRMWVVTTYQTAPYPETSKTESSAMKLHHPNSLAINTIKSRLNI